MLGFRSPAVGEVEIVVGRPRLQVLKRQLARPHLNGADRALLAAFSALLSRSSCALIGVGPETVLRWQRRLVVRRWIYRRRGVGRQPVEREVRS